MLTAACQRPLSSATWIQAAPSKTIFPIPIVILHFYIRLGLPTGLFPSGFPSKTFYAYHIFAISATCPANPILPDFVNLRIGLFGEGYKL
jgi:hypothetical protein